MLKAALADPVGQAADGGSTRRRGLQTHDHPDGRRLARTVGAEEPGHNPGPDLEAEIGNGLGANER